MSRGVFGTLGNFTSGAAGTAVDVSHLTPGTVTVTIEVSTSPALDATVVIEQSMDGTTFAPCTSSSSSFQDAAGCFVVPAAAKMIRANTTDDYVAGTAYVRYGGRYDG